MRPTVDATYSRVTLLAPRSRVDVALPADVPVAELVPMVLELVGEPLFGLAPEPWRLSGAAGGPLPPGATLGQLGVLDGDLLRLAPESPPPAPPVFDDPVDALAATAGAARAGDRRFGAAAVLSVAVMAGFVVIVGTGGAAAVLIAATGSLVAIGWAAQLLRLPVIEPDDPHRLAAAAAALAAVPLATAAGWVAVPGASTATHVMLAAAAAATAGAAAQIALRVVSPALVGIVTTAVPVGLGALAVLRFGTTPPATAAAIAALALAVGPSLPRLALRLAGLPRPIVPADGEELVEADDGPDLLPPEELAERADLARGYLGGLAGGAGVLAAAGALMAAGAGGWAGPAFAGVAVVVLGLRARTFADRWPARTVGIAGIAAGVGLAVLLAVQAGRAAGLLVGVGLMLAAAVGVAMLGRTRPIGSPVSRRAVDLLEGVLVAAAVPLAIWAMDLYRIVRGL